MSQFIVSCDLGKERDYTAIIVFEQIVFDHYIRSLADLHLGTPGLHEFNSIVHLRHIERPPLGTPYREVIGSVKRLVTSPALEGKASLLVDITGAGNPVVEWMREEGLNPLPICITGGLTVTAHEGGGFGVPKRDIAGAINRIFQQRRIRYPSGLGLAPDGSGIDLTSRLLEECQTFAMKISTSGKDTYEALREGDHDDVVLAVGMGAWYFLRENPWRVVYPDGLEEPAAYNPKTWL